MHLSYKSPTQARHQTPSKHSCIEFNIVVDQLPISAVSPIRPSPSYLSSVNTRYNPPIPSGRNVAWVKIFEQKRVCLPADSYGRVSPKQSPRWPKPTPLYADTTLSPALNYHYAPAAQISDFLKLHWREGGSRKRKGIGECQDFIWHSTPWTTCHLLNASVDIAHFNPR